MKEFSDKLISIHERTLNNIDNEIENFNMKKAKEVVVSKRERREILNEILNLPEKDLFKV